MGADLSSEENARMLLERARAGDRKAREELVESFLPLVDTVTRSLRRKHRGIDPRELWQEGAIGLLEAMAKFAPGSERPFWSFARAHIWRTEMDAISREYRRGMTLTRVESDALMGVARSYKRLSERLGREPAVEELGAAPDLPREVRCGSKGAALQRLEAMIGVLRGPLELDRPREDQELENLVLSRDDGLAAEEPEPEVWHEMQSQKLRCALARLTERQRRVVTALYLDGPHTWAEAGEMLGLRPGQMQKALRGAMRRLREMEWLRG